jgi:hypothetical protein
MLFDAAIAIGAWARRAGYGPNPDPRLQLRIRRPLIVRLLANNHILRIEPDFRQSAAGVVLAADVGMEKDQFAQAANDAFDPAVFLERCHDAFAVHVLHVGDGDDGRHEYSSRSAFLEEHTRPAVRPRWRCRAPAAWVDSNLTRLDRLLANRQTAGVTPMKLNAGHARALGIPFALLLAGGLVGVAAWRQFRNDSPSNEANAKAADVIYFQDLTPGSGVDFTHVNGEEADHCTILESLGGGVALIDFDGDGLLDIFVTGGGTFSGPGRREIKGAPCALYKNLGNFKFRDVTAEVGLDKAWFYNHGCAVGDFDCDGWPDLLVTGYGGMALFHNESDGKGGRRFVEVTKEAGLTDGQWCTSAAWADLNGDGYPDLYVCRYLDWSWQQHRTCRGDAPTVDRDVCAPENFRGISSRLYRNNRNGTFTDVTADAGVLQTEPNCGKGLGVVIVDVDGDRRPDIYVANDTVRNFLYWNRSDHGRLRFTDTGLPGGAALGERGAPDGSMGVDAADYNGSGRPSLFVTTFEGELPALYVNDCGRDRVLFRHESRRAGLAAVGTGFVGFGTGFLDLDLDGWEDLVTVNGHVRRFPTRCGLWQKPLLLRNQGDGTFAEVASQPVGAYFGSEHRARGLALGDLDNDGRVDLVISHVNSPVVLLRNVAAETQLVPRHWLGIELIGRKQRDITGAKVVVDVGERRLTRFARSGGSYLSSSDRRLIFGLADAKRVDRVTVFWLWGEEQQWTRLPIDRYWRLVEGEAAAGNPIRK